MRVEPDYPQYFCRISRDYDDTSIWAFSIEHEAWEWVDTVTFDGCEIPEFYPVPQLAKLSGSLWYDEQSLCVVATSDGWYVIDGYELEVER